MFGQQPYYIHDRQLAHSLFGYSSVHMVDSCDPDPCSCSPDVGHGPRPSPVALGSPRP